MKILFIGLNWLGDVIMSLPAILSAAAQHEVHVLTRPHLAEIYQLVEGITKVHKITTNGPILTATRHVRQLNKNNYDKVISLPDSLRAAAISWLSGSSRYGYQTQNRNFLLTNPIPKPENFKRMHESLLHFNLLKEAIQIDSMSDLPQIGFSEYELAAIGKKLKIDLKKDYFVLAPGAAFGAAKRWPEDKFTALAKLINKNYDSQILITGSNSEKEMAKNIADNCHNSFSIAGATSLTELAVILNSAKALIANDSGTMHLAALFKTPTIVPVGPTDMVRTGPLNKNAVFIYGNQHCEQAPCRLKVCPLQSHICMNSISAEMVFSSLKKFNGVEQ